MKSILLLLMGCILSVSYTHLDVYKRQLYSSMGFQYRDTIQLFYDDTGLTDYMLYEYLL